MTKSQLVESLFGKLSDDELFEIIYGDNPDFKVVSAPVVNHIDRWSYDSFAVVQHGEHFFSINWTTGNTEYQETEPNFYIQEVKPIECTIYNWEPV